MGYDSVGDVFSDEVFSFVGKKVGRIGWGQAIEVVSDARVVSAGVGVAWLLLGREWDLVPVTHKVEDED